MWALVRSLDAHFNPWQHNSVNSSNSSAPELAASTTIDTASAAEIYAAILHKIHVDTDRLFALLMVIQWIAGIVLALTVSPYSWIGDKSQVHLHVWAAVILGGLISSLPLFLVWKRPGEQTTRLVIAVAQMLWSALLIHLTGGRLETHFHVFGSLAFLAFYRDWRVLVTATIVVAIDHGVRGIWWPQSVFGVIVESPYRWIEHAAWVVFEDIILIRSCIRGRRESRDIAEREARLSIANRSLEAEIIERKKAATEVKRLYNDLTRALDEAIAANQIKNQFLANMSHELRTPLNAIIGYSELLQLLAARKNDTSFNSDLIRIHKAGTHLLALINDILDLSKIEAGKMDLEICEIDLRPLIEEIEESVIPLAAQNANRLVFLVESDVISLQADSIRLKQCLLNLLSNACKFTREGCITFQLTDEVRDGQQYLRFRVTDTGIGLSAEQASRLFQPFTQADASTTRKYGGTGLGLAITKKLSEAMGGFIELHSQPGAGSEFSILLPACREEALLQLA